MTTTPEQIAALIGGYTALKQYFEDVRNDIEQRVAAKEAQVNAFLQDATPETRYVQDIKIGGSTDFLYPVWFGFPGNEGGVSRLTIARCFSWNGGADERPLDPSRVHQAGLLLEMEGNGYPWGGDANFMEVKRFKETYNNTASHVSFAAYCKYEATGTSPYEYPEHTLGPYAKTHSSVYLRGGGLRYRIIKNWTGNVQYSDSDQRVDIRVDPTRGTWYVEPIPFADRLAPIETVNAFVDAL